MKALSLVSLASIALAACSAGGSSPAPPGSGNQGSGNQQVADYPAPRGGYGRSAHAVMQNYTFQGYKLADVSQGLQSVSLADYYDPCQKRLKLLHITVGAVWCGPCNQETDAFVAAKSSLDSQRVVVIQALDDGATFGTPATDQDLQFWIKKHNSNFTEMLDPGLKNLAGYFDAAAIPWNANIDPRTMEIIDSSVGFTGAAQNEVQSGLDAIALPANFDKLGEAEPACP